MSMLSLFKNELKKPTLFLLLLVSFSIHSSISYSDQYKWAAVKIQTDPPGAHVYGQDGTYWGKTKEGSSGYVYRIFYKDVEIGYSDRYTITARKRGYKITKHTFPLRYHFWERDYAEEHADELVIVLDLQ